MKQLILAVTALVFSINAHAQLTLEDCQKKARAHYPEIAQYDLISQSEQYNLESASRSWIPQITLSAQATWPNAVPSFHTVSQPKRQHFETSSSYATLPRTLCN